MSEEEARHAQSSAERTARAEAKAGTNLTSSGNRKGAGGRNRVSSEQWGRNASVPWHGTLGYSELAEPCGVTGDHSDGRKQFGVV